MLKKFSKGLLTGGALGGILGLLFAPEKGTSLRHTIVNDLDLSRERVENIENESHNLKVAYDNLKKTRDDLLPTFKRDTQKSLAIFASQAKPLMKEINTTLRKIRKELR